MKLDLRPYRQREVHDLRRLMGLLGYNHSTESLTEVVAAIRKNGGEIYVADHGESIVGCAAAIIDIRLASGISGEIVSVVVDQAMRGKGVGRALVVTAENWLQGKVSGICIRANSLRVEAPQFYQSLGYSLTKNQSVFSKSI